MDHLAGRHERCFGNGHSARSATVRLSTPPGTSEPRRDRAHERAVVLDVVERRHVDAGDVARSRSTARASRDPPRFDAADEVGDLADRPLRRRRSRTRRRTPRAARGCRCVPARDHERVLGAAVLGAQRHAREVEHVQDVRVDELGREKPRTSNSAAARWVSTLKSGTPAVRSEASMSTHGAYARSATRRVVRSGLIQDLQPLVASPMSYVSG